MFFRPNTNDEYVYNSVFTNNEYNVGKFKDSDLVIDIGAHIGSFSLRAWENGSRNIFSFEPFSENFKSLQENVRNTEIKIFNKAVRGNYKFTKIMMDIGENIKTQTVKNYGGICIKDGGDVDVITLEDIIHEINQPIKLLKLDCEGSEFPIIFESPDYIFDKILTIVGEIHNCDLPVNFINGESVTHQDFILRLENLGYIVNYKLIHPEIQIGYFHAKKKE